MKDYLIWLAEKLEKNLHISFDIAMEIATTCRIIDRAYGYTVWDYLEERDASKKASWSDFEADVTIDDHIEAEG